MALTAACNPELKKYVLDIIDRAFSAGQKITLDVKNTIELEDAVRQKLVLEIDGYLDLPQVENK